METKTELAEFPELSLMEGGPGDALMKRLRLIRPEFAAASGRTAISSGSAYVAPAAGVLIHRRIGPGWRQNSIPS